MSQPHTANDVVIVKDSRGLVELSRQLRDRGSFALDTEFIRERTYRPRLCLLQIAFSSDGYPGERHPGGQDPGDLHPADRHAVDQHPGDRHTGDRHAGDRHPSGGRPGRRAVLVDPLLVGDLGPFLDVIADPAIEKVVHSGEQDMEIFYSLSRRVPRNVVDTQVAAALTGRGEAISYARLVEDLCGVRLSKAETYTDWSRRPLSPRQIEYAAADVAYLPAMIEALRRELSGLGRLSWLTDELRFYEAASTYEQDPAEAYRKVRGMARLNPRGLAVLRELAAWREEEASELNWPRGKVLPDETLIDLARRCPLTLDSAGDLRGIPTRLLKRSGKAILERIARGLDLPEAECPQPVDRTPSAPEISAVVDLLDVVVAATALELKIAPSYLASRKELYDLALRELGLAGSPAASGSAGVSGSPAASGSRASSGSPAGSGSAAVSGSPAPSGPAAASGPSGPRPGAVSSGQAGDSAKAGDPAKAGETAKAGDSVRPGDSATAGDHAKEGDSLKVLSGWRRELVGERLLQVLRGASEVFVDRPAARVKVRERHRKGY